MTKLDLMLQFEVYTEKLQNIDLSQDAEELISIIEELLSHRDKIIEKYNKITTDERVDDSVILRVLQKNNQLETLFEEIMLKIDVNLKDVFKEKVMSSQKKKANRGYLNPGHQNDGYFIDKKK